MATTKANEKANPVLKVATVASMIHDWRTPVCVLPVLAAWNEIGDYREEVTVYRLPDGRVALVGASVGLAMKVKA